MKFLLKLLLLLPIVSYSQEYVLKAGLKDLSFSKIYLATISGEKYKFIDSAKADMTGGFQFKFNKKSSVGQYRLFTESSEKNQRSVENGKKNILDFLYNREDIEFYTTAKNPSEDMRVVKSTENMLYFDYLKRKGENKTKLELLNNLLANYPKTDDFYKTIETKVNSIQTLQTEFVDNIITKYPDAFITHIVKVDRNIETDTKLSEEQKNDYLKLHYFDKTDFNDTLLMNSSYLTNKVIGYLTLYREKQNDRDKQEVAFIRAVDHIMKIANKNKKVYEFVLDYLITGFERFEFEKVRNYIADNSTLEELCQNEESKTVLETKIESYKKFSIGKKVPDIAIKDMDGKEVRLSDIKSEFVLIIFWASWCPHCEVIMPDIKKIYDAQKVKKFEVLSISVDDNKDNWLKSVNKLQPKWINCCELKGWDGKTVKDYCVYATPTLYLVDKSLTIVSKPMSIEDLNKVLKN